MTTTRDLGTQPEFGQNRSTGLFVVWLFVGVTINGIAAVNLLRAGFVDAWLMLLNGVHLLWFMIRDWFFREGGDFVDGAPNRIHRRDDVCRRNHAPGTYQIFSL